MNIHDMPSYSIWFQTSFEFPTALTDCHTSELVMGSAQDGPEDLGPQPCEPKNETKVWSMDVCGTTNALGSLLRRQKNSWSSAMSSQSHQLQTFSPRIF